MRPTVTPSLGENFNGKYCFVKVTLFFNTALVIEGIFKGTIYDIKQTGWRNEEVALTMFFNAYEAKKIVSIYTAMLRKNDKIYKAPKVYVDLNEVITVIPEAIRVHRA